MFRCRECGHEFTNPKKERDDAGECWGVFCSQEISVCPNCGEDTIEKSIRECDLCGAGIYEGDLYYETWNDDYVYCSDCIIQRGGRT